MFQVKRVMARVAVLVLLAVLAGACSWIPDGREDCPTGCQVCLRVAMEVKYEGMFNTRTFADEVNDVTIYVFDDNGKFAGQYSESGENLKQNDYTMNLPLDPGYYKMVVWTGVADSCYCLEGLEVGVSDIEDFTLRLERDAGKRQEGRLTPLWHGRIARAEVRAGEYTLLTVDLTKDTNVLTTVLQSASGEDFAGEDYSYEIVTDNGCMNYDNQVLDDEEITYSAYQVETAQVSGDNEIGRAGETISVARAELNTLRLMKDRRARFVVKEKSTGKTILNINLTEYLLLTRSLFAGSHGMELTDQEYLDYEDRYSVIFFLTSQGDSSYACNMLKINGWVIRLNNAELTE